MRPVEGEAGSGGRGANRRRTASPARDVHTKNSGMNSTAMNVAASMPPPPLLVSISKDSLDGATNNVALLLSTSTK